MERLTKISFPDLNLEFIEGIESGSLLINKVLYTEDLKFGQLCANRFEVNLYGVEDVSGQKVVVTQTLTDDDGTSYLSKL